MNAREEQAHVLHTFAELHSLLHEQALAHDDCVRAREHYKHFKDCAEAALAENPSAVYAGRQAKRAIERGQEQSARHFATEACRFARYKTAGPCTPIVRTPQSESA